MGNKTRIRLNPAERREEIIEKAIHHFANVGFSGSTRDLSAQLGISQSLLYHYFATKNDLIDAVGEALYAQPWREEWDVLLEDETRSLSDRLTTFYTEYSREIQTQQAARIFVYSGLAGIDLTKRSLDYVRQNIYPKILRALQEKVGGGEIPSNRESAALEIAWSLHATIFYLVMRRDVFALSDGLPMAEAISLHVNLYLNGAIDSLRREVLEVKEPA